MPGDRADVDDARPLRAGRDHLRRELAGAQERAGQIDRDDAVPLLEAHLLHDAGLLVRLDQQPVAEDAGVVDERVETAEPLVRLVDEAGDVGFVGDVRADRDDRIRIAPIHAHLDEV